VKKIKKINFYTNTFKTKKNFNLKNNEFSLKKEKEKAMMHLQITFGISNGHFSILDCFYSLFLGW